MREADHIGFVKDNKVPRLRIGNATDAAPSKNPPLAYQPKRTLVLLAFSIP